MSRTLEGKVALVTGASRGSGRAIAVRLAREGALVAAHYGRDKKSAAATVREIGKNGGKAFAVQADLSSLAGVHTLFEALDQELEKRTGAKEFDVLVNNAGVSAVASIEQTSEETFDGIFAVNVKAPFFIVQQALGRLRDGGRIINITSALSQMGYPAKAAYAMSKAAINNFTLALAKQLGPRGITVNALGPGIVNTDMNAGWLRTPQGQRAAASAAALGRAGEPEEIADVAAFLASPESRWMTGAYLDVSGGSLLG